MSVEVEAPPTAAEPFSWAALRERLLGTAVPPPSRQRRRLALLASGVAAAGAITFGAAVREPRGAASGSVGQAFQPAGSGGHRPEGTRKPAPLAAYRPALPPYRFRFPRDHASHPEYQTEWWYYTGHLQSGGRRFGYELTFFQVGIDPRRKASRSAWALHTLYFAHLALTDETGQRFRFAESVSRPALGMAGAETARYRVWVHDWSGELLPDGRRHRLRAQASDFGIDLELTPEKPPVVHGQGGVSQKAAGPGRASHYYSLTRMATRGTLILNRERLPVHGLSWMDHEFGSNQLAPEQSGWDWFSIQLHDRRELMLFRMRRRDGGIDPYSSGSLVEADGRWRHLNRTDFRIEPGSTWKSPRSGAVYPAGWTVRIPAESLELRLEPTVADQELRPAALAITYWEGSVTVSGRSRGRQVSGEGYVELTGYAGAVPGI